MATEMRPSSGATAAPRQLTAPSRGGGRRPGMLSRLRTFVREVVAELKKVIYPSRTELVTYVIVVIVFVTLVVAFVSLLDFLFTKLVIAVFG